MSRDKILDDIRENINTELLCQRLKWGEQNHTPHEWLSILVEEVGEVAEVLCRMLPIQGLNEIEKRPLIIEYCEELVQVAAVAISMIECIDRQTGFGKRWKNGVIEKKDGEENV